VPAADSRPELPDETFEADAETETMLLESMARCDDGRPTSFTDLLSELRSRE